MEIESKIGELEIDETLDLEFTVLVVDANRRRSNNLKYILDGLYFTKIVDNVESAIRYLHDNDVPDLIISTTEFIIAEDYLKMNSSLDGLDLCKYIKETDNKEINDISILILMEKDTKVSENIFFNAGVSDIIYIPYDILDLFSRIEVQLNKVAEKRRLFASIEDLLQDRKTRSRKNVDFRTKLFAKQRDTVLIYEEKVKRLRDLIISKKQELENAKLSIQDLKRENIELLNELKYIKSKYSEKKKVEKRASLDKISDNELNIVEKLFNYINKEYLFEENLIKKISENVLKTSIDFKKIDNFYFINNIVNIVKKYVKLELEEVYRKSKDDEGPTEFKEYLTLLVDYIIKVAIHKFLFFLSMNLLEEIGKKDGNATKFLKFYDGRIEISPNGTRFQKPLIGDEDGSWNMISMIQIINQRVNGHKIILEQESNIHTINSEFNKLEKSLSLIISLDGNNLLMESLKKQKPFIEKIDILDEMLNNERNEIDKMEISRISDIDEKMKQLGFMRTNYEKNKTAKEILMSKYSKQVAYYKPTEEKFIKVALSVAKVMLKVKVIR